MCSGSLRSLLLMFRSWVLLALFAATSALAAPGSLYASGITGPAGLLWIPGGLGGHLWVSDGALGLCRVDFNPLTATSTLTNCLPAKIVLSPAQTVFDSRNNLLYVADKSAKALGVVRLQFNPLTETLVAGTAQVLTGSAFAAGMRPASLALNPVDGDLYVGFIRSPNVVRITSPATNANTTVVIAQTSDARKGVVGGMAFNSTGELFLDEKGGNGITVIPAAQQCETVISGVLVHCGLAELTPIQSFFPAALTADSLGRLYIGEAPATLTQGLPASVLRYDPVTDTQDVVSSTHPPLLDGTTSYRGISALAVAPDFTVYIGDDATLGLTPGAGHLWVVPAGAPPDALGQPGIPALAPPPPAVGPLAQMYSWGHQAPNGFIFLPGALGGHLWTADESGLCRVDPAPNGPHAINVEICDPGSIGTPATPAFDPRVNPDGTHYLYVPEIDRFSAGVWRVKYDPSTETILPNVELMVPFGNLGKMRPNSVALGPDGDLYVSGKSVAAAFPGAVFRIVNPNGPIRLQQIVQIGTTSDGKGTNGSMVFVGNDLYLPENNDLGVIRNAVACATSSSPAQCTAQVIPLVNVFFAAALATDGTNVYVANSPGAAPAIIVRYNTATHVESILVNGGVLPADPATGLAATPATVVNPNLGGIPLLPSTRTEASLQDSLLFAPAPYPFRFILAMYVDPAGNLHFGDDPFSGSRAQRGHSWIVPNVAAIP
jgi:hypothetical protein